MDMEVGTVIGYVILGVVCLLILGAIFGSFFTVNQATVAVITRFGKYKRIALPGLCWKTPFLDSVYKKISTQNRSQELKFQAITMDQANVYFTAMLLYAVLDATEDVIQKVAYKFNSEAEFNTAITKTIEGAVRSFVAGKKQAEILNQRKEIIDYVKLHLDDTLKDWGYHLIDLQVNDIRFDDAIMESMSHVVASSNLKAAAENEGQALLITKTKAAEAEGNAIRISAQAEKEAAKLRGEGVAAFRQAVTEGISESVKELANQNVGTDVIMFSMWTEAVKNFAEVGKGNVIFLDGTVDNMQKTMKQMASLNGKLDAITH